MNEKAIIDSFRRVKEDIEILRMEIDKLNEKISNLQEHIEEPLIEDKKELIKDTDLFY